MLLLLQIMFKIFRINWRYSEFIRSKALPIPAKWFPGGLSFSLFHYPVANETRKGPGCENCGDECSGHYFTDLTIYINLYSQAKAIRSQPPRSDSLRLQQEEWKFFGLRYPKPARKCLLPPEEVKLWLEHLHQVAENRMKGAEKARVSHQRREKKGRDIMSLSKAVLMPCKLTWSVAFSLLYAFRLPKLFAWVAELW